MSSCDLCGRNGELFRVKIEGSLVCACESCSGFGKVLSAVGVGETKFKHKIKHKQKTDEKIEVVIDNYNKVIKGERERLGLKQKELAGELSEKESLIQKIENKQIALSLKLARKLEKFFAVELVKEESVEEIKIKNEDAGDLTLGDVIEKQKRLG